MPRRIPFRHDLSLSYAPLRSVTLLHIIMEQELAHVFAATLSADAASRGEAEAHLAALHATPACGHALSSLLLSAAYPLHLRQAAALSLRKWINERWSPYHQTFVGLPPSNAPLDAAAKPPVRAQLLQALTLPERALRLAAAYALSSASAPDWPDDFPELLPSIRQLLEQGGSDATHGAMCFLADFVGGELDETQIMGASRELLPSLEKVLADTAVSVLRIGRHCRQRREHELLASSGKPYYVAEGSR
jgi:hypothetical protein